jgi:serine protease Do
MPRSLRKAEDGRRRAENIASVSPLPTSYCIRLALALFLGLVGVAHAQTPALPAALEQPESSRPEQRAELRRELERQVKVLEAQSAVVKIVAKLMGPSVVFIEADVPADVNGTHRRDQHKEDAGSGVIIEWKDHYYVLTNRHVVRDAAPDAIRINLADGRRIHPTKVLQDSEADVAVLLISATDIVGAVLGDSDRLEIGDFVLAVGSPFGLNQSVTFGILSAKGRRKLNMGGATEIHYQDFLQTDAAINPGNSGGPLVNLHGEVIGINTAIASDTGIFQGVGFAIPINMFMAVGRQLIETGTVTRAFLGVNLDWKFGPAMAAELGLPRPVGARITSIVPNSPAESAKLQTGDVILEFNHTPVEDDAHLVILVSMTSVGKKVPIVVFRDRKPLDMTVEVGDAGKIKH